jgi:hypothetical protein
MLVLVLVKQDEEEWRDRAAGILACILDFIDIDIDIFIAIAAWRSALRTARFCRELLGGM